MQAKCIGCGLCKAVCPALKDGSLPLLENYLAIADSCLQCQKCVRGCPTKALEIIGRNYEIHELLERLVRDRDFYEESSGGVTFSGGEPLLQGAALKMLMEQLTGEHIHCAVETAGNVPWKAFENVRELAGLFICDIKALDDALHNKGTGAGNGLILDNFKKLYETGADILVRIPVIPGFNAELECMQAIAGFLSAYPAVKGIELMPFHTMAQHKYQSLCMPYQFENAPEPSPELIQSFKDIFKNIANTIDR